MYLRTTLSILFLSSWLLFQYSRILTYQRCQITPLSSTQAVTCDCQKQSPEATTGDKQHNADNSTYKFRPDEVFMAFTLPAPGHPLSLLLADRPDRASMIVAGCTAPVFQPPRGNVLLPLFI